MITAEQARQIQDLHTVFVRRQSAKGVDGPVPEGRKAGSDYNQHFSILEASGADWDEYDAKVREILGLPPLAAEPVDFGAMRADINATDDEIERAFNVNQLRFKAGTAEGGQWRRMSDFAADLLKRWARGEGSDDPLGDNDFSESQLRTILKDFRAAAEAAGDRDRVARLTPPRAKAGEDPQTKVNRLKTVLYTDVRDSVRAGRESDRPSAKFTLQGKAHRDLDVAVYRDKDGKPRLFRESEAGKRGGLVAKFDSLDELQAWAERNDEPRLAQWAAKERGGDVGALKAPAKAAKKAVPAKKAAPSAGPFPPGQHSWSGHDGIDVTDEEEQNFLSYPLTKQAEIQTRIRSGAAHQAGGTRGTHFGTVPDRNLEVSPEREAEIRAAVEAIPPGSGGYVSLREVRERLAGRFDRAEVDNVLQKLNRSGDWHVVPEANQKVLTPRERLAAVVIGGQDKHAIRVMKRAPEPASPAPAKAVRKAAPRKAAPTTAADIRPDDVITLGNGVRGRVVSALRTPQGDMMVTYRDVDRPHKGTVMASMELGAPVDIDRPPVKAAPRKASPTPADPVLGLYTKAEVDKLGAGLDLSIPASHRLVAIKATRRITDALAEFDQFYRDGASDDAMLRRLEARRRAGVPDSVIDELQAAVRSGDRGRLERAHLDLETRLGLSRIGITSETTRFDPKLHKPISEEAGRALHGGAEAEIVRPGYHANINGEEILVSKADVVDKLGAGLDKTDPNTQAVINAEGRRRVEAVLTDIDQMLTDGGTIPDVSPTGADGLSPDPAVRKVQLDNRVREAYRDLRNPGEWVGLADLREHPALRDLSRQEQDEALKGITRFGDNYDVTGQTSIRLIPVANSKALSEREWAARLVVGDTPTNTVLFGDPTPRTLPTSGGASTKALLARLDARRDTAPAGVVDELTAAVESGDRDRVRQTIADIRGRMGGGSFRKAATPRDLPSGADIEKVGKLADLSPTDIAQGHHLTPAGRRALDALGPAGHPRIAAIPDTEGKIREAYRMLALPGLGFDSHVALLDVRKLIGDQASRSDVDGALRRMFTMPDVRLSPQSYARENSAERISAAFIIGGQQQDMLHIDDPTLARPSQFAAVDMAQEIVNRRSGGERNPMMALLSDEDLRAEVDRRTAHDPITARDVQSEVPDYAAQSVPPRKATATPRKATTPPEGFDPAQLDGLSVRQKRARLKAMGFTPEQINELAPTAAMAKKKAAKRSLDLDPDDIERAEDLDDEDDEDDEPVDEMDLALEHYEPDVERAAGRDVTPGNDQLHHFWTQGPGLARWVGSPTPWRTLLANLVEVVKDKPLETLKKWTSRWYIEVFHYAAGSDKARVAHGKPPRGHRVGPG